MKTIVIAPETDYVREVNINKPKGRAAREMMPKVVTFMKRFEGAEDENSLLDLINKIWEGDEFEQKIVPYVLNLDSIDGRQYLNENCTNAEILAAFTEAATYLMGEMFNRPDLEIALKKSNGEAQEALSLTDTEQFTPSTNTELIG